MEEWIEFLRFINDQLQSRWRVLPYRQRQVRSTSGPISACTSVGRGILAQQAINA